MNCKNCNASVQQTESYCSNCGAQIVTERITLKSLWSNLLIALGWDSNFSITVRHLLYRPQAVIQEYIDGTRKKYANPFGFLAIVLAVSLFLFSNYSEQFIEMTTDLSLQHSDVLDSTQSLGEKDIEMFGYKSQKEFTTAISEFQIKNYNLLSFLLLPVYSLLAFFVFRKPYNFGEHLVINTYINGMTTVLSVFLFVISLLTGYNIFGVGITAISFVYYCFVYKALYKMTLGRLLLKILKFMGIIAVFAFILIVIVIIQTVIKKGNL